MREGAGRAPPVRPPAVRAQQAEVAGADHAHEERRGEQHHQGPAAVRTIHALVHVEGDGLVFGLLEGVPEPEPTHARVPRLPQAFVGQQLLGHDRGEVLERAGDREPAGGGVGARAFA